MWQYNTQNHCTIGNISYCLVFGQLPRVGISALPLDGSFLTQLATEAQLDPACNHIRKVKVLDNNRAVVEAIDNAEETETANKDEIQVITNNTYINGFMAAVDNFNNINITGVAADNLDEFAGEILQRMVAEENSAQGGRCGACLGGSKSNAVNLISRLCLYHFLHTMSS